jgi:hypothetical protein
MKERTGARGLQESRPGVTPCGFHVRLPVTPVPSHVNQMRERQKVPEHRPAVQPISASTR